MSSEDFASKRIIFDNGEGGVSILMPAPNCGLTLQQIRDKDIPAGRSSQIVEASDLPTDRTFRNAWTYEED